jgi:FKBP-type peptidyl-prolyl cis-trans isomerase SlyD
VTTNTLNFVPPRELLEVSEGKVVTLKYALFDAASDELLEYRTDLIYLHGAAGGALPHLQAAVAGMRVGMKRDVNLTPQEAFGLPDPALVIEVDRADLPAEACQAGATVEGEAQDGIRVTFRVTALADSMVTLNGNHPLAGKSLHFVVEVADIRNATEQEREAGYAFRLRGADATTPQGPA